MTQKPAIDIQCHDTDAMDHPVMDAVQTYWCSLNGGALPKRADFEFMDIYQQAPHLIMSQRIAPKTFSFIYCGTHVAENFPFDLTGRTVGPDDVEASRILWFDYKTEALDTPCIRFGRDDLDWPNLDFNTIFSGIFPLSDDDGVPLFALACLVFLKTGHEQDPI